MHVQVYFMSDGKPVNNFRHWQGIIEGAGYRCVRSGALIAYLPAVGAECCVCDIVKPGT